MLKGDDTDPKIRDLKTRIHLGILLRMGREDPARAEQLHNLVESATVEMYHPQIWRLNLSRIDATRMRPGDHPGWDEIRIEDLTLGEFDEILE